MRLHALAAVGCAVALLSVPATADAATLSTSQAKKLVKAGVLTQKDLPGWEFEATEVAPTDNADEAALYKCLGLSKPSFTARNRGYDIGGSTGLIDSSADVASSTAKAKAYLTALQSKKAAGCVKKEIVSQFVHLGAAPTEFTVSVKAVPITVKKADQDAAFHIVESFNGITLDGYQIEARVGRTEISLAPATMDGTKPTLSPATSLMQTLVKRVRALS